jgi:hypothetical protein
LSTPDGSWKKSKRGVGDVLSRLEAQPLGIWLLIAIAAELAAYGMYLLLAAWYLRLVATR